MNSILITGCNRGLGLGLVKTLVNLPKPPEHIFATCRDVQKAEELVSLAEANNNLHIKEIDLRQFNCYDKLIKNISDIVKDNGLNVLFNNAGVAPKSVRINYVKEKDFLETFTTNTIVPVMLAKACLSLLKTAAAKNKTNSLGVRRAAIINMSSIVGSMTSNTEGAMIPYRVSKAGLNAATKSLSIDLKTHKILCVSIHPGWVRTDMGGSKAPLDIKTSCNHIVDLLECLNEKHNGGFYQYDGQKIPW